MACHQLSIIIIVYSLAVIESFKDEIGTEFSSRCRIYCEDELALNLDQAMQFVKFIHPYVTNHQSIYNEICAGN